MPPFLKYRLKKCQYLCEKNFIFLCKQGSLSCKEKHRLVVVQQSGKLQSSLIVKSSFYLKVVYYKNILEEVNGTAD